MTRSAFVVGASGQIGRAAVRVLAEDGWEVRAASRRGGRAEDWPGEVRTVAVDREDTGALAAALGDGCDVLLDCVAYDEGHARQLLGFVNIAELVRLAARRPGSRVLNAGDPQPPTVAEIGAAVDAVLGYSCETVLVDGEPPAQNVGNSPWAIPKPVVYDMAAAERELGYRPVTGYAESLEPTIAWLVDSVRERDWREAFPLLARVYGGEDNHIFDYAAEDRWLNASRARTT